MYYVIGSGPSGVACAYALLRRGCAVTMIDAGLTLETSRTQQIQALRDSSAETWSPDRTAFLREGMAAGLRGIPVKRAFGSDFPYRAVRGAPPVRLAHANLRSSYARGGFSNVWGAAVLPYHASDIPDWPFPAERLDPHYAAVFEFVPLSARSDELEQAFPLFADRHHPLVPSRQAEAVLDDMDRHRSGLAAAGVHFGSARLAVRTGSAAHACSRCALCLYGCPYELIYCSSGTLRELGRFPGFRYISGVHVDRVFDRPHGTTILGRSLESGQTQIFEGARAYLACGVLQSTRLVLRSLEMYDTPVSVLDSQYFLLPMLRFDGVPGVREEPLHTLAQLFLEVGDPAVSPHLVHLQTYTYSDVFEQPLRAVLGPVAKTRVSEHLVSRLILLQGFVHSSHSARIRIRLTRSAPSGEAIEVTGEPTPETGKVLRAVLRKLRSLRNAIGAVPLRPLLRLGAPGRGDHTGGSFPMRRESGLLESDEFGRPAGWRHIHVVDASVFPSVAATTITLTAMANAHRIGDEIERYA